MRLEDLGKAFHCVNHDTLLSTLRFWGIRGKTFSLIKSYLEDRHQRVILNEKYVNHSPYSYCGKIKHHVSQRFDTWTIAFPILY